MLSIGFMGIDFIHNGPGSGFAALKKGIGVQKSSPGAPKASQDVTNASKTLQKIHESDTGGPLET